METALWVLVVVVGLTGYGLVAVIEKGLQRIADRISSNTQALEGAVSRVGSKLDNLWSPLQGISNAAHGKTEEDWD